MSKARELAALGNAYSDGALSNRRINHNGAMTVWQRGTNFTGLSTGTNYCADRYFYSGNFGQVTASQATDAPSGFTYSLKVQPTTSGTPTGSQEAYVEHRFEGQDLQQLGYGVSTAKTVTLSFWVKSSVTGDYGIWFYQETNGSNTARGYTINSANTWEHKTIVLDGDTANSINTGNGIGMRFRMYLDAGPDIRGTLPTSGWAGGSRAPTGGAAFMSSTSNTWQLTGVQLEVGDTATPFEHRSYGQELALCQRYYEKWGTSNNNMLYIGGGIGMAWAPNEVRIQLQYSEKRTSPTCSASGTLTWADGAGSGTLTSFNFDQPRARSVLLYGTLASGGLTGGKAAQAYWGGSGSFNVTFDAEL